MTTWLLYPDPCFSGRAGFRNLDPSDGGWFLNPMLTVFSNCQFKSCTDSYSVTLTGKSQAKVMMMRGPSPSDGGWEMPTNRRSWIWNHYLINEQQYPDDARCCHCDRKLKFKSNSESRGRTIYTSTLIKHLYSVHQIDQNGKFAVQSVASSWS